MSKKRPSSTTASSGQGSDELLRLSQRQRDIAARYARGLTYKQIAAELFIAPATVRSHLATIYRELGIGNKADLMLQAIAALSETADDTGAEETDAREALEKALPLYDRDQLSILSKQLDPYVQTIGHLGMVLACMGYPEQGQALHRRALDMAGTLHQPVILGQALLIAINSGQLPAMETSDQVDSPSLKTGYHIYPMTRLPRRFWSDMTGKEFSRLHLRNESPW